MQKMRLTDEVFRTFKVAKVFRENTDKINCIDFSSNGENMIASSNDDSIVVYCCLEGRSKRTVYSKKYGCDLVQYTHAPNAIIYTSNKIDDTIRYLSLHDNKYLRYFPGHTKQVVTLRMSPVNDMFLSGSLDRTIRLWDLRSPNCQGLMHLNSPAAVASFDPEGLIFAAGIDSRQLKLYDLRSFDKGPFSTFHVRQDFNCEWTGLKFSADGKKILVSTNISQIKLVDAFHGHELFTLQGHLNSTGLTLESSFTPDSRYVISGSQNGRLHVWSADTGEEVIVLDGGHPHPSHSVQFNPKLMMMASACKSIAFWLPATDEWIPPTAAAQQSMEH